MALLRVPGIIVDGTAATVCESSLPSAASVHDIIRRKQPPPPVTPPKSSSSVMSSPVTPLPVMPPSRTPPSVASLPVMPPPSSSLFSVMSSPPPSRTPPSSSMPANDPDMRKILQLQKERKIESDGNKLLATIWAAAGSETFPTNSNKEARDEALQIIRSSDTDVLSFIAKAKDWEGKKVTPLSLATQLNLTPIITALKTRLPPTQRGGRQTRRRHVGTGKRATHSKRVHQRISRKMKCKNSKRRCKSN